MDGMLQENLLNTAPCGFVVFSDEGVILAVNDTLLQLLNYERSKLVGAKFESILSLANRIFYQTHLFPLIKLHGSAEEIFLTLLSGSRQEVHVLLNAIRKHENGSYTNHCICIPVKQRRKFESELLLAKKAAEEALMKNELLLKAQKELETYKQEMDRQVTKLTQINRELSQFSKVISHDIQEPIRKISIFADLALSKMSQPDSTVQNALEKIKISCHRMSRLVISLEMYLSFENSAAAPEPVDLNVAIEKAKQMAIHSTGYIHHINFQQTSLPVINAYKNQIELLFFNLIENAIRFRKAEEELKISIDFTIFQENSFKSLPNNYRYRDVVKISLADNGAGFETAYSINLFQLFQKLQTDSIGIGLGLALSKKIVDNHFGEIAVDSEPGKGTTFHIMLPVMN